MISRREAFRVLGMGAAVGVAAGGAVVVATKAGAAEPDPSLAAVERHQRAYEAWCALKGEDDPSFDEVDKAEIEAWEAVCGIVPTTYYGLARMAGHVGAHYGRDAPPSDQSIQTAFMTIAWAAASLHYKGKAA